MNHSIPDVELQVIRATKLSPSQDSPSQELINSVIMVVDTKSEEIFVNQTTGLRTSRLTSVSPSFLVDINLRSSSPDVIRTLLHDRFVSNDHCLCDYLAPKISTAAINLGFGYNGFTLTMNVTVTYKTVTVTSNDEKSLRMVLLRRIKAADELKSLNMETESCSVCLEDLVSGSKPSDLTRMTCSHVFHSRCLLEWLKRKNTCPMCRTVLEDR